MARLEIQGVLECTDSCTFDYRGRAVNLKGIEDGLPGTLVLADHPIARDHAAVFRQLAVETSEPE